MGDAWHFDGSWGKGFGSDSEFIDDGDSLVVGGGICQIVARRTSTPSGRAYASTIISTRDRWSQAFGTWEARLRLPSGRALWPAFWLDPADGSWPPEIDIVEALPPGSTGNNGPIVDSTLHYSSSNRTITIRLPTGVDLSRDFHVYKMVWTAQSLAFYLDGNPVGEITSQVPTEPMFPILNLAVGGQGIRPDKSTPDVAALEVDYIRITP